MISTKIIDNDDKGKLGGTKRRVSYTFEYRLLELLENEEELLKRISDAIKKEHFDIVRSNLKYP